MLEKGSRVIPMALLNESFFTENALTIWLTFFRLLFSIWGASQSIWREWRCISSLQKFVCWTWRLSVGCHPHGPGHRFDGEVCVATLHPDGTWGRGQEEETDQRHQRGGCLPYQYRWLPQRIWQVNSTHLSKGPGNLKQIGTHERVPSLA